jgi:hypothetical protein
MGPFAGLIGGPMGPLALVIGGAFRVLGARLPESGPPAETLLVTSDCSNVNLHACIVIWKGDVRLHSIIVYYPMYVKTL